MVGFILGMACGAVELLLLRVLVKGIADGSIKLWVVPAKLGVLALFFLPCVIFVPSQLYLTGIGAAAVIIVGAGAIAVINADKNGVGRTESQTGEDGI